MLMLAIESSCDETAAAVVENGRRVLSNCIASSVPLHAAWGGVVPEIASRAHLENILPIVHAALSEAGIALDRIDAVAVTRGPGLIGSLLVGMEFAKALAASRGIPLLCVQHIAGHLISPALGREVNAWGESVRGDAPPFVPYVGLTVSGGHSSLVHVKSPTEFFILGETLDDAVGEAYDKIAKHVGLGYPGGPLVDRTAAKGDGQRFAMPRPLLTASNFDFSFSGLKTAFVREVGKLGGPEAVRQDEQLLADLCASFQAAAVDVLLQKARRACKFVRSERLAIVGGVACNRGLRTTFRKELEQKLQLAFPEPEFCTDNAAMIAAAAYPLTLRKAHAAQRISALANLTLDAPVASWQS